MNWKLTIDVDQDDVIILCSAITSQINRNNDDKQTYLNRDDLTDEQKKSYVKWFDGNTQLHETLRDKITDAFKDVTGQSDGRSKD